MPQDKKKLFPKVKKSLKNFLTDESGKITKKDALGLSAGAALIGVVGTEAFTWPIPHSNVSGHINNYPTSINPPSHDPFPANSEVPNNSSRTNVYTVVNSATCNHASGVVNGHFSQVPTVNMSNTTVEYTKTHSNGHASHGSHGSHGSHCSW